MFDKLKGFFGMSTSNSKPSQNNSNDFNSNDCNNEGYQQHYHPSSAGQQVRLLKKAEEGKKVVAVIVSFVQGSSYDSLFTSVQQKVQEGTQVLVYACSSSAVGLITQAFKTQSKDQTIKSMVNYIKQLDPDCVVFNWECCSGYSSETFPQNSNHLFNFVKMMIDRGYMCMFSDFSLKALIKQWDKKALGPNPFVKVNEFGGEFKLQFNPQTLRDCPSAQLQIIGEMAAQGHCNVHALGGTIVYGVDKKAADNDSYKLQILTVATSLQCDEKTSCKIEDKKGTAGHVLLTYKSGGCLLTSMGHWIELMKIDTSDKVLFEVAAREYGDVKVQQMRMEYENLNSECERKEWVSKNAVEFVQNQAPCTNMAKKARSKY